MLPDADILLAAVAGDDDYDDYDYDDVQSYYAISEP